MGLSELVDEELDVYVLLRVPYNCLVVRCVLILQSELTLSMRHKGTLCGSRHDILRRATTFLYVTFWPRMHSLCLIQKKQSQREGASIK
jgi:hypothetical protein